ncbi:MAG: hypothetical protein KC466_07780, partial [Myxococcales bacterium]|nr:hypothetical protein [Myxococcales bacterium]
MNHRFSWAAFAAAFVAAGLVTAAQADDKSALESRYGTAFLIHDGGDGTRSVVPAQAVSLGAKSGDAAAAFLAESAPAALGVAASDLRLDETHEAGGLTYAIYSQTFGGVPVWDGRVSLQLRGGKLVGATSRVKGGLNLSTTPNLSADDARDIASTQNGFDAATDAIAGVDLYVYDDGAS